MQCAKTFVIQAGMSANIGLFI